MGHLLGYARVSTTDQQPHLQVDALAAVGCYRVFTETASGAGTDRPTLEQVLDQLRPGDTLVVWKQVPDLLAGPTVKVLQVSTRRAGLAEEAADALRRKSYSAGY
jgi:predicted site-specific integrase-resolvase